MKKVRWFGSIDVIDGWYSDVQRGWLFLLLIFNFGFCNLNTFFLMLFAGRFTDFFFGIVSNYQHHCRCAIDPRNWSQRGENYVLCAFAVKFVVFFLLPEDNLWRKLWVFSLFVWLFLFDECDLRFLAFALAPINFGWWIFMDLCMWLVLWVYGILLQLYWWYIIEPYFYLRLCRILCGRTSKVLLQLNALNATAYCCKYLQS